MPKFTIKVFFNFIPTAGLGNRKPPGFCPLEYNIADICIVSEQVIWAVGDYHHLLAGTIPASFVPKLLKTTDGGETWK